MIVRQKDRIVEVFPSFSAVNQPEANTLNPIMTKLVATMRKPRKATAATCSFPLVKKSTTVPPSR